jgi:hypothetical protein
MLAGLASGWELVLDASCSSCGFYQQDIVVKPGMHLAPCPVCGRIVTSFLNTTIGAGECKACGSWLNFYPDYLCKLSWWLAPKAGGGPRRSTPAIFICPQCGNQSLSFVCTEIKTK